MRNTDISSSSISVNNNIISMYNVHCIDSGVAISSICVHRTTYNVQCIMYNVLCTLYNEHVTCLLY